MIDIHSHILPGLDDGSKDINMTLEMLKRAEDNKTKKIVATPHYCIGYGEVEYLDVKKVTDYVRKASKENNINIDIYCGQEVFFTKSILDLYEKGIIGTINDSAYMLIELPMQNFEDRTIDTLYELNLKGINIILAHPERYIPFINEPERINDFIDEGILFQMNSGSVLGTFGKSVKKTAEIFLKNNIYSFIGSDAHNNTNRKTGIQDSISFINKRYTGYGDIFDENANLMLNNNIVKFNGQKIPKKKKFFIF